MLRGVMCSQSAVNHIPMHMHKRLITSVLRGELNFTDIFVHSDGGCVISCNMGTCAPLPPPPSPHTHGSLSSHSRVCVCVCAPVSSGGKHTHTAITRPLLTVSRGADKLASTEGEAAALSLHAGVDMDFAGCSYSHLAAEITQGRVAVADLDRAVSNVLRVKFATGASPGTQTQGTSLGVWSELVS